MFSTFADWAAIFVVAELGIIAASLAPGIVSRLFRRWVNWRTYRHSERLLVLTQHDDGRLMVADDNLIAPGNILRYLAIYTGPDGPLIWRHLADVTFVPLGDMGLVPIDGPTVRPTAGYARCRFVVTRAGRNASVIAYSGPVQSQMTMPSD